MEHSDGWDAVGWDLVSVASVPEGNREGFDHVRVLLRCRTTGKTQVAEKKHSSPWIALALAIKQITGEAVNDQPKSRDSLIAFTTSALIDVNRTLHVRAKQAMSVEEPNLSEKTFEWPEGGSVGDGCRRVGVFTLRKAT